LTISVNLGSELDITFTDLLANGQAVGRAGGAVVFCFGPLPGETARVRIAAMKPKYAVAELIDILETSPERSRPFCPVFGTCGGCQVQHLEYGAQLRWKREVVRNALIRIGGFPEIAVAGTIGMRDPTAYRNKMSLVVDREHARVGFYKQRSHEVVEIDGCPIVMPHLDAQIPRLNAAKSDPPLQPAFSRTRHIVARTARASGETVVTFTTAHPDSALKERAASLGGKLDGVTGLTNSYDLSGENAILGRKEIALSGSPAIEETIAGLRYRVSTGSFFQVNVEILERIFERLAPLLIQPLKVLDLYCGAGTFALFFAKLGSSVLGIEESEGAVEEARRNAQLNGLHSRARFERANVSAALSNPRMADFVRAADAAFLDPPRKGCEERVLAAIAARRIPSIWYLSCDPATLARDLKFLSAKGYRTRSVQPFDMFPQTGHVETLVLLERSEVMRGI
jgi:23S rRNA (uracil1939-C5)-methyltransferase